jgi:phage terminase large subunit
VEINFRPQTKQHLAFQQLESPDIDTVIYGGSLGSGKSWLGCAWLIINSLRYKGSRWFMGRSRLSTLRKSTILTMNSLIHEWGLDNLVTFNNQQFVYTFSNGSEIHCLDFFTYPSDTEFTRFGGQEYTGGLIDEGAEVSKKAITIIKTRIRYKLDEFKITGKLLVTTNPCPGFLHEWIKTPPEGTIFVKALTSDNKFLSSSYVKSLESLDPELKNRLLLGNWTFDDDFSLFEYEKMVQTWYNEFFDNTSDENYITCDPADTGQDRTVIILWRGWNAVQKHIMKGKEAPEIVDKIKELMFTYKVKISNVIVDSSGVGSGIAGYLHGCVKYYGNGSPLNNEKYPNIKAQLYYKFAYKVNNLECNFNWQFDDKELQEFMVIKKVFKNDITGITTKDEIKRQLGRSNDISDALYLRAFWEFKKTSQMGWSSIN